MLMPLLDDSPGVLRVLSRNTRGPLALPAFTPPIIRRLSLLPGGIIDCFVGNADGCDDATSAGVESSIDFDLSTTDEVEGVISSVGPRPVGEQLAAIELRSQAQLNANVKCSINDTRVQAIAVDKAIYTNSILVQRNSSVFILI